MRDAESLLLQARTERNAARTAFDLRVEQIRTAVSERSLASRAADEALTRAQATTREARAILGEYGWVAAITALALVGWLLRAPLMRWGTAALDRIMAGEPESGWQRFCEWTARKVKS